MKTTPVKAERKPNDLKRSWLASIGFTCLARVQYRGQSFDVRQLDRNEVLVIDAGQEV